MKIDKTEILNAGEFIYNFWSRQLGVNHNGLYDLLHKEAKLDILLRNPHLCLTKNKKREANYYLDLERPSLTSDEIEKTHFLHNLYRTLFAYHYGGKTMLGKVNTLAKIEFGASSINPRIRSYCKKRLDNLQEFIDTYNVEKII